MIGNDGVVSIDGVAVARVLSFSYAETKEKYEKTAMGSTEKEYDYGLSDGNGSVECTFVTTDYGSSEGQGSVVAALKAASTIELDLVVDSSVSSGEFVGISGATCTIDSWNFSHSYGDTTKISFDYTGVLNIYSG